MIFHFANFGNIKFCWIIELTIEYMAKHGSTEIIFRQAMIFIYFLWNNNFLSFVRKKNSFVPVSPPLYHWTLYFSETEFYTIQQNMNLDGIHYDPTQHYNTSYYCLELHTLI